jgi:hypothetical protein
MYLHIGAMKTGTSFLQGMLTHNAEPLRESGVFVVPGRGPAVADLVNGSPAQLAERAADGGAWAELVSAARSYDGRASVLSHELLSIQRPARADKIVKDFRGLDLDVVLTVRDATHVLPAQWQTTARNHGSQTWPEYVAAAHDPTTRPRSHTFLLSQRVGRFIRMWRDRVGAEHVHVVTVPGPGAPREALWERFASVLQVDPAIATQTQVESNPSTGYATAHLVCLVHAEAARRGLPDFETQRLAGFVAAQAAMRRDEGTKPPLDRATLRFTAGWNREVIRVLRRSRVRLVGDESDLPVKPDLSQERRLQPPDDESLDRAAQGAVGALTALAEHGQPPGPWSSVEEAVGAVTDAMAAVIAADGPARLNRRGTAPLEDA